MKFHGQMIITQSPQITWGFSLGVVQPMCLKRGIMTCIHCYNAIWDILIALKILCASPNTPPSSLTPVSIVLPFLECHTVGIIQYVAFSYRLSSVSNICLRFLHVFSWLDTCYLFITQQYSIVWMYHSLSIYLLKDILVASKVWQLLIKLP